jgi:hypothetical protein
VFAIYIKKILTIIISGLILCTILSGCSNNAQKGQESSHNNAHYVTPKEKVLKGIGGPGSAAQH